MCLLESLSGPLVSCLMSALSVSPGECGPLRLLRAELLSLRRKGALKIGGGLIGNGSGGNVGGVSTSGEVSSTTATQQQQQQQQIHQQQLQTQSQLQQQQYHQQHLQQQQLQLEQNNHNLPSHPLLHESNRHCARCSTELGRITNRGAPCRVCKLRVCKACREFTTRTTDWVCVVCHKQM